MLFFLWCALMYYCPMAAAKEQRVSRLQCASVRTQGGHRSADTVLGWGSDDLGTCVPKSLRFTRKKTPVLNLWNCTDR